MHETCAKKRQQSFVQCEEDWLRTALVVQFETAAPIGLWSEVSEVRTPQGQKSHKPFDCDAKSAGNDDVEKSEGDV